MQPDSTIVRMSAENDDPELLSLRLSFEPQIRYEFGPFADLWQSLAGRQGAAGSYPSFKEAYLAILRFEQDRRSRSFDGGPVKYRVIHVTLKRTLAATYESTPTVRADEATARLGRDQQPETD